MEVYIDLSKAFDTVDHSKLLKKTETHCVNSSDLAWFASDLIGRKQCIKITESADTVKKDYKCGKPQGPGNTRTAIIALVCKQCA